MKPGGGTIHINCKQSGKTAEFTFSDNGSGMSEEVIQKIFTTLFTTKAHGTGFGLAICKKIVEAHGEQISVQSALGQGTTFIITLPRRAQ